MGILMSLKMHISPIRSATRCLIPRSGHWHGPDFAHHDRNSQARPGAAKGIPRVGPAAAFVLTLRDAIARRQHAVYSHLANLEEAFSSFDEAICLVGPTGAVMRVSPLAREIFAGPMFAERHGTIWHADPRMRAMLLQSVAMTCQTGVRQSMTIPAETGVTVTVDMVVGGPSLRVAGERCVLMRMQRRNSGDTQPNPDHLAAVFRITPAEARVLAALVTGQTAAAYAASAGVSVNTVRKQIAMLMAKMQCNRQSELVRKAILGQG